MESIARAALRPADIERTTSCADDVHYASIGRPGAPATSAVARRLPRSPAAPV